MGGASGLAKIIQRVVLVLMLTILPIALISAVWDSIAKYVPLFFGVVFLMGSGLFVFFYVRFYDLRILIIKLRRFIREKESIDEYVYHRFKDEDRRRSNNFLIISIGMAIAGAYMMYKFFNPTQI